MFLIYTQVENHMLNPIMMSRTVKVNPLLVLLSILIGAEIGSWIGGIFGAFVAALLAIPAAGAIQVLVREIWQTTAPQRAALPPGSGPPAGFRGSGGTGPARRAAGQQQRARPALSLSSGQACTCGCRSAQGAACSSWLATRTSTSSRP